MRDFLTQHWDWAAVLATLLLVAVFLTVLVLIIATAWSRVRRDETRANLIRDLLERGFSIEQVERLAYSTAEVTPAKEKELEANLASVLVQNEVPAATLERVMRIYQETHPATKKAVYDALDELIGSGPNEEQLLAAVRALCPPRAAAPTGQFVEAPGVA